MNQHLTSPSFPNGLEGLKTESEARGARPLTIVDVIRNAVNPRDRHKIKHGHAIGGDSPTYESWLSMLVRVRHPERDKYNSWAGRGVTVCDRWLKFENFLEDMGERPPGKSLDRFPDQGGNYEPSNCRWATRREQARNSKVTKISYETALEIALARFGGEASASIALRYGVSENLPNEIYRRRCWPDAHDAARLKLGMHLGCFYCAADAPSAAYKRNGIYTVACEANGCWETPAVSAGSEKAAWLMWDSLGVERS